VAADLKGDYEQPVTFGEVAELRRAAPRVVVGHGAVRAGATARRGELREATKALRLLRGASLPAPLMQEYENEVVGPVEDDLVEKLNMAFTWTSGLVPGASAVQRNRCNLSWRRFETLRPRLAEFAELAGADSYAARRVFEHAASKLLRLAVAFDDAAQRQEALFVCYTARMFAPPGSEELPAIDAKLLALGVVEDSRERSLAEYAGGVMSALTRAGAPPKLFRDDPKGEKTLDSFTSKSDTPGCLTSVAFWLALVVACVGLRACGVINMRSTRTPINSPPPLNLRPNLNYNLNLNYNVPPPLNLRPYNDPLPKIRRQPGGKSRRQPLDVPLPPPTTIERAPNVNASPPR
jgi:hypothetical protein